VVCLGQGDLYEGFATQQVKLSTGEAKATVLDKLEQFCPGIRASEDLGLRLDGEQLAAGVRFVAPGARGQLRRGGGQSGRIRGCPRPACPTTWLALPARGKADLYAAFLERGWNWRRPLGLSGLVTIRGWMFLGAVRGTSAFNPLRSWPSSRRSGVGAFEDMTDNPVTCR